MSRIYLASVDDSLLHAAIAGSIAKTDIDPISVAEDAGKMGEFLYFLIGPEFSEWRGLSNLINVLSDAGARGVLDARPTVKQLIINSSAYDALRWKDPTNSPGPLYAVNYDAWTTTWSERGPQSVYFGLATSAELIDGAALASAIGLSAGTAMNSSAGWLKWMKDGKLMYVAKIALRNAISWDHINAANAVYGTRIVSIKGKEYKVRLLTGGNGNPATGPGGEWSEIIYGAHQDQSPNWANYKDTELGVASTTTSGYNSWCQETLSTDSSLRVLRGLTSVTAFDQRPSNGITNIYPGWRPVLELVQ